MQAVDVAKPPLHLPLGETAFAIARRKLAAFQADMEAWEDVAKATGYGPERTVA